MIATKPPLKVDAIVVQADLAASLHLLPVTPKVLEKIQKDLNNNSPHLGYILHSK